MDIPDVALIAPFPASGRLPGGVASYSARLAGALRDAGARVAVVAPAEDGEPATAATRAARATGAPVVHLQHETFLDGGPGLLAGLADLRRARRRAVVTMHHVVDPADVDRDFTRTHGVRAPAPLARAGLAALQGAVRRLASEVIVHEPQFEAVVPEAAVVPHGVEAAAARDRGGAQERLGVDDGRLVVLCFGFVAPDTGLEAAMQASVLAGDDVHLVVAGGEHPRLAALGDRYAERLRVLAPVGTTFTGDVPDGDVPDWFAAADVALLPYPRPFATSGPLALALAHGTPALLSTALARNTGAPAALAVEVDPPMIAARLRELAERPARLADLRTATRSLAAGRSWPEVADRHLALYAG